MCSFDGCDRPHYAKGLCQPHRHQQLRGRDLAPLQKPKRRFPPGTWRPDPAGYMRRPNGGQWIYQHREVMATVLGRDLLPGENVHHLNGNKSDNRPENLQLWVTFQPRGQRPEDLVAWAHEILSRYSS